MQKEKSSTVAKLFSLESPFTPSGDQPRAIDQIVEQFNIKDQKKFVTLLGVTGSGKTFTMANVINKLQKKTLILAPNKTLAAQLHAEFKAFFPHNAVEYFISYYDYYQPEAFVPSTNTFIEKDASINDEIDKMRHSATKSLIERDDVIVVSSVSCIYGIGSVQEYSKSRYLLKVQQKITIQEVLQELIFRQYERSPDPILKRGFFKHFGDRIDLVISSEEQSFLRLEFFDNTLDSISWHDLLTGKKIASSSEVTIYPKSHYIVAQENIKLAVQTIQTELRERLQELQSQNKHLEANRLAQRTMRDVEMLEEIGFCPGIENYTRHINQSIPGEPPPTLIDYFGDDFLMIIDESHLTISQVAGMYHGDRSRKLTLVEHGFRLPSALDNRPLNFTEFEQRYKNVLFVSATPGDYELEKTHGEYIEQLIRPTGLVDPIIEVRDAADQVKNLLIEMQQVINRHERILITTLTKKLSEELCQYYQAQGLKVKYLHSDIDALERMKILMSLRRGDFDILIGINLLREGLDLPEVSLVAILDADKEGFLRSKRSLIQTIGRAARNVHGKVIMYAYQTTKSMLAAIEETERRRKVQQDYNLLHHISPISISKNVTKDANILNLSGILPDDIEDSVKLDQKIKELKDKMQNLAKELKFEEASKVKEEIKMLTRLKLLS